MKIATGILLFKLASFLLNSVESRPSNLEGNGNNNNHSPQGRGLWYQLQPDGSLRFGMSLRIVRNPDERTPGRAPEVSHMDVVLEAPPSPRREGQRPMPRGPTQPPNPNIRPQPPYLNLVYGSHYTSASTTRVRGEPSRPQSPPARPESPPAEPQSPPPKVPRSIEKTKE